MNRIRIHIIFILILLVSFMVTLNGYIIERTELKNTIEDYKKSEIVLKKILKYYSSCFDSLPFGLPLDTINIISDYGWRNDPFTHLKAFHYGVDLLCDYGEPIMSTSHGQVIETTYFSNYGNCVIIKHSLGYMTLYAHLSKILVKKGDFILKGDIIGLGGNTGRTTGIHLHYEILNKNINPIDYLKYITD